MRSLANGEAVARIGGTDTELSRQITTMIVEQTGAYPNRMRYDPQTNAFLATPSLSLGAARGFTRPYGWIRESGTPPQPHWDVILMSGQACELGDAIPIRVIGVFRRGDGDHKLIAVPENREIEEFDQLEESEKESLRRLYPRVGEGEGWFGRSEAERILRECEKPL